MTEGGGEREREGEGQTTFFGFCNINYVEFCVFSGSDILRRPLHDVVPSPHSAQYRTISLCSKPESDEPASTRERAARSAFCAELMVRQRNLNILLPHEAHKSVGKGRTWKQRRPWFDRERYKVRLHFLSTDARNLSSQPD